MLYLFYNNDFGINGTVEDLRVSKNEYINLKEDREEEELNFSFRLKVSDYILPHDELNNTFLMTINQIENPNSYNPHIEIVMERNLNYNIALLDKPITDEMIKNNEPLKLLVYSEEKYQEFDIFVTELPILTINVKNPVKAERPIGTTYKKAGMTLYNNTEKKESDLYIRIRGGSSRVHPKNQYRINLREFTIGGDERLNHQSLLGMREDDDWIIYSPYNDPEKVRNTFSNNLWHDVMARENRFKINTGTEGKYVEVFINNHYWGLYTLMHPIDAKQLDLDIKNDAKSSEIYYRTISNFAFFSNDFKNSLGNEKVLGRFELREPNEPFGESEQWKPLYEHMMMQRTEIETLKEYLYNHTDIENQINYYLFTLLLQATDNNFKNHNYISKFDGNKRIMLESPWDLDLIWGLRWHPESPLLAIVKEKPTSNLIATATLVHSAIQKGSEDITQQVKEKYWKLRANEWSEESLMSMLDEYEKDIYHSGAILRDKERWPDTAYNENMDQLRNYILQRLKAMDDFIENEI